MRKTVTVTLDEVNYSKAIDFLNVYDFEKCIDVGEFTKKTYLGDTINPTCRFCGKTKSDTSFNKLAHTVPQFIGNRFLLSAFECDICNKLFGDLYENSFANYIGAFRPFSFVKPSKNNNKPKFKETVFHQNEEKIKLAIQVQGTKQVQIYHEHPFDDSVVFDRKNKTLTVNAVRKPYVPLYVYKMLLKIGLSIIEESEIHEFKQPLALLLDNSQNEKLKEYPLCHVYMHSLYGRMIFSTPIIYLYKKKQNDINSPSKTVILCTGNHIYQIFIPLCKKDQWMEGKNISIYPYPLLFDKSIYEEGMSYSSYGVLMDSNEKKIDESQQLTFSYREAHFHDDPED